VLTAGAVVAVGAAGALAVFMMTGKGMHLTPDSISYVGLARSLAGGDGYSYSFGLPGHPAETDFPPLLPTALALGDAAGVGVLRWASWLNSLLFAGLVVLVAAAVWDMSRSAATALLAAVLTGSSVALLDVFPQLWSEPVFFVWEVLALWALARYRVEPRTANVAFAAAATALAMLTRYAGVSLLLAGVILMLTTPVGTTSRRVRDAASFALIAGLPVAAWMARNVVVGTSATGRSLAYHPLSSDRWHGASETIALWLRPLDLPGPIGLWWLVPVGLTGAVAGLLVVRHRSARERWALSPVTVMVVFVTAYALFLLASVSTATPDVSFNNRIFAPALVALIMGLVLAGRAVYVSLPQGAGRAALVVLACVVAANSVRLGANEVKRVSSAGAPFQERWKRSSLVASITALPEGRAVYSNLAGQLFIASRRHVLQLPDPRLPNGEANPEYHRQLDDVRGAVHRSDAVVAVFTGRLARHIARRGRWPSPAELAGALGMEIAAGDRGDALLRLPPK